MRVLFLSSEDLSDVKPLKGSLLTRLGVCELAALCGRLLELKSMGNGWRLRLEDPTGSFEVFAETSLEAKLKGLKEGVPILLYASPNEGEDLVLVVRSPQQLIQVGEGTMRDFHRLREKAAKKLEEAMALRKPREEMLPKEKELLELLGKKDEGEGVEVESFLGLFPPSLRRDFRKRLKELLERGFLYEPKPGFLKLA